MPEIVAMLTCPSCGNTGLGHECFRAGSQGDIHAGVVWCRSCSNWYPVIDGVLELLAEQLAYPLVRQEFWRGYEPQLRRIGLEPDTAATDRSRADTLQVQQQKHSDWYAENERQSYTEYEHMPFWLAVDDLAFDEWKRSIKPNAAVLDMGCGQGRSTFKLMDLPLHIVAFDISRKLVHQAQHRYLAHRSAASASFIVADASRPPFIDACFDDVLVYGVLHHLPDPGTTCREIARLLRPGGMYFGCENNQSVFRKVFDALQRLRPLWYEEAGPQPLISGATLDEWFRGTGLILTCQTRVFLPPHLVNRLGFEPARRCLKLTDRIAQRIPIVQSSGGLIMISAEKPIRL